jgi:hypothetical protein
MSRSTSPRSRGYRWRLHRFLTGIGCASRKITGPQRGADLDCVSKAAPNRTKGFFLPRRLAKDDPLYPMDMHTTVDMLLGHETKHGADILYGTGIERVSPCVLHDERGIGSPNGPGYD